MVWFADTENLRKFINDLVNFPVADPGGGGRGGHAVADLGGHRGRAPPWAPKFFQFHAVFGKIWQNCMLAPPLGSWRPFLGKSWIRRCHAPPGPVKISHKKDGCQRRPHRFHISCPPPLPSRWIRYCSSDKPGV